MIDSTVGVVYLVGMSCGPEYMLMVSSLAGDSTDAR